MTREELEGIWRAGAISEGDIVQINPEKEMFGGCFLVVTEVKDWGVMGYGQDTGKKGQWYLRVDWADLEPTGGKATWVVE